MRDCLFGKVKLAIYIIRCFHLSAIDSYYMLHMLQNLKQADKNGEQDKKAKVPIAFEKPQTQSAIVNIQPPNLPKQMPACNG